MRYLIAIVFLTGLLAPVNAGVLDPIDRNKIADINGKTVDLQTLQMNFVPTATSTQPVVPIGNQRVDRSKTISSKFVETKTVNFETRDGFTVLPFKTIPQTNFTAKRAALEQPSVNTQNVSTKNASINQRVIRPLTPAGDKELQEQINTIQ